MTLLELLQKFNYQCSYCERKIDETEATREHLTPNSVFAKGEFKNSQRRGGGRTRGRAHDIVFSFRYCNQLKGKMKNMSVEEFKQIIKKSWIYDRKTL